MENFSFPKGLYTFVKRLYAKKFVKYFIQSLLEILKDFNYSTDFIHGHLNTIRELMPSFDFSTENSFMAFCLFEIIS
jgi:hypothetical protein